VRSRTAPTVLIELCEESEDVELTPKTKQRLASVLRLDLKTDKGLSPLCKVLHGLALSLVKSYEKKKAQLRFGRMILPKDQQCGRN